MDIYDNIANFLKMENTGALLIVGAWGSGKTYYLDNVVFKKLKESDKQYHCIRVSLFGVKDTKEIPYRVFQAYTDSTVKDKSKGIIKYDKIRDWAKGIYSSIPKLKEIVDLSPLFTQGNAAYSLVPKDTIICFDDIERATETLDINEILGAVNELVENRHYKVILIANKEYIDNKLQTHKQQTEKNEGEADQTTNKTETERELFYEKVVEKTIAYEPDIPAIYCKLVKGYNDKAFTAFMEQPEQQDIVNPEKFKSRKYQRQLQNIRTLKFAIVHFFLIWQQSDIKNISDKNSLAYKKLHNYWLFTHAVAIEQKAEHLQYDDDKGLSKAINFVDRIYWGEDNEKDLFVEDDDVEEEVSNVDATFIKKFKKRHFESFQETFVFYKSIYDFLTASKPLDMTSVDAKANETFNVQNGVMSPAYEILNTLLTKGFWTYTNEEAPQKLLILYDAVEKGELNDYVSYYNAGVFLFGFKLLVGKTEKELKTAISNGVEIFTKRLPEVSVFTKTQIDILPSEEDNTKWIKEEIGKAIDERLNDDRKNAVVELEDKFLNNMTEFVSAFKIEPNKTPAYFNVPILDKLDLGKVEKRIPLLEPEDVMQLYSFVNYRYLLTDCQFYVKELPFLEAIIKGVENTDLEKPLLSNNIIERFLKPALNKATERLDKF